MKALAFLLLFCAASYGADINTTNIVGDIKTVISERQDTNGTPQVRIETVYRGKQKILQIVSEPNKQGKLAVAYRGYFVAGELVMTESDKNGDGVFEHLSVRDPATEEFELFVKQADGSVVPESTEKIKLIKKEKAVADEAIGNLIKNPDPSDEEISKSFQEIRQKIQDLQKQDSGDKH